MMKVFLIVMIIHSLLSALDDLRFGDVKLDSFIIFIWANWLYWGM